MVTREICVNKDGVLCTPNDPYVLRVRRIPYFVGFFWIDALAGQCTGYPEVSFFAHFHDFEITNLLPGDRNLAITSNHRIQIGPPHNIVGDWFEQSLEVVGRESHLMLIGLTGQRGYQDGGGVKRVCESSMPFLICSQVVDSILTLCEKS